MSSVLETARQRWTEVTEDGNKTPLYVGIGVGVLVLLYVITAVVLGGKLPSGTTISGVQVGGLEPDRARAVLQQELAAPAAAPVKVTAGNRSFTLTPAKAGLSLDLDGSVDGLSGFSLNPVSIWQHLTGGVEKDVEISVDRPALEAAVRGSSAKVGTKAVEGSVSFKGGTVKAVAPRAGTQVDVDGTVTAIADAWPTRSAVPAAVTSAEPKVSAAEVERFRTEWAEKAVSGPVTVKSGASTFSLAPKAYAVALGAKPTAEGRLEPSVSVKKLAVVVHEAAQAAGVEKEPKDAEVSFSGNTPVVRDSRQGVVIDDTSIAEAVPPALTSSDRTATVTSKVVEPEFTTAEARATLPKEVISTFTTYFPDNPPRTNNIKIAARTLNGTYVAPGEQFSLNGTLGERTAAKGYAEAPVILNGRLVRDYGGGVSQVSTTLFNAVFFSGAQIDEFLPHSFYISRYPEGREATVSWPDVDQKFTNDTGAGILIRASVSGNALTVTFHGRKVWDIDSVKGPRRNVVEPKKITDDKETCVPQQPAEGFDVTVTRIFKRGGTEVKRSQFNTHYIPEDEVVCTHPDAR